MKLHLYIPNMAQKWGSNLQRKSCLGSNIKLGLALRPELKSLIPYGSDLQW